MHLVLARQKKEKIFPGSHLPQHSLTMAEHWLHVVGVGLLISTTSLPLPAQPKPSSTTLSQPLQNWKELLGWVGSGCECCFWLSCKRRGNDTDEWILILLHAQHVAPIPASLCLHSNAEIPNFGWLVVRKKVCVICKSMQYILNSEVRTVWTLFYV